MVETLTSIGKYFWVKTVAALVSLAGFEFFVMDNDLNKVIYGLFLIIFVDSFLGVYTGYRMKRLASWKMGQPMARKVALYSIAIFSAAILANSSDYFNWFPEYIGIFFILSEILSIFEKLALLGVPIPVGAINKVNSLFKRYSEGDRSAADEILKKKSYDPTLCQRSEVEGGAFGVTAGNVRLPSPLIRSFQPRSRSCQS